LPIAILTVNSTNLWFY